MASQQWDINQNIFSWAVSRAQPAPTFYPFWLNKLWSALSASGSIHSWAWIHGFQDINLCQKRPDPPVWKWDVKHLNHKVAIILLDWLVHFCQLVPKYEYMTHHKYAMNQPTLHPYYTWMIDHRMLPKQFYFAAYFCKYNPKAWFKRIRDKMSLFLHP